MKRFVTGVIIGIVLSLGVTAFASSVKQYILTEATYPIVVNGVEYKDDRLPILNYEGNTYVPLAQLGDLTGVQYLWNDELSRVEIDTSHTPATVDASHLTNTELKLYRELAEIESINSFVTLTPGAEFVIVEEEATGYNGFSDEEDTALVVAQMRGEPLPPKLSEGWVSERLLSKIFGIGKTITSNDDEVVYVTASLPPVEVLKLTFPEDWEEIQEGEVTVNGIRIKKHNGINYFNISDLEEKLK